MVNMYDEKVKDKPQTSQSWFNLSKRNITCKPLFVATALMCLSLIWTFHFAQEHKGIEGLPAKNWRIPPSANAFLNRFAKPSKNDLLILYAYHETPNARLNTEFFLNHGLHDNADFIFIFNGETNMTAHPAFAKPPSIEGNKYSNIQWVQRNNSCFDLGAFGEVMRANDGALQKKYSKFITMNASIRGPFVPLWSDACWSDIFLNKLSDTVKLVGTTYNCRSYYKDKQKPRHLQSMIWATDRIGMSVLMESAFKGCAKVMGSAIWSEMRATTNLYKKGYKVEALMTSFHSNETYAQTCMHSDMNHENEYYGINLNPFETIFQKANRGYNNKTLEMYTKWYDDMGYDSYKVCGRR